MVRASMRSGPAFLSIRAPMACSNWTMVAMSRTLGMRCSVTGSSVSRQAASAGKAEFFAPLVGISPRSGVPPRMTNLSMFESFRDAAAGRSQALFRSLARDAQPRHHDRSFHCTTRGVEQLRRATAIGAAGFGDDANGPLAQLRVGRLHVHHQVAVDVSQPYHDRGAEHVQHELGGGAR